MSLEIIIALLALFLTIVANIATIAYFAGVLKSNQSHQREMLEIYKKEIDDNFNRLERKQDKHNGLIERMAITEKNVAVIQEQIKVENHRIEDLEDVMR